MAAFDLHKELNKFFDEHVVLGAERRKKLAEYRDACVDRVKRGLELLGEKRGKKYAVFTRTVGQGSYTMRLLNQHPNDEFDIDVALIFAAADLPASAPDARVLIADALLEAGGGFKKDPEARTNAVTVWYADGAHVDFAIYREVPEFLGLSSRLEHAGPDWGSRDPEKVTRWFKEQVDDKSPEVGLVRDDQLRRIVRWVKMFARSRLSWSLPGGMILTVLACEVYRPDRWRDDVALVDTLKSMKTRLAASLEVLSPIDGTTSLTAKPPRHAEMKALVERLDQAILDLAVIENEDCTREQALRAWGKIFNHSYWSDVVEDEVPAEVIGKSDVAAIDITVAVAPFKGGKATTYSTADTAITKGHCFRFTLPLAWQSMSDTTYRWIVTNTGDEARAANDMGHTLDGTTEEWRSAAYKGLHSMTCEVLRGGVVVARGVRRVQVARW